MAVRVSCGHFLIYASQKTDILRLPNNRKGTKPMKRLVSLLITYTLTFGLCACAGERVGETTEPTVQGLQVGYAKVSITPGDGINLGGYGNEKTRISTGFLDYLYATCIALKDGENVAVLFSTDVIYAYAPWTEEVRTAIHTQFGIPKENIHIGATHIHTGPELRTNYDAVLSWKTEYVNGLTEAAGKAIADLAPAVMYGKKVQTENQNFVRHYKMSNGTYAGSNFGDWSLTPVAHAVPGDPEMTLVKFAREGEKKDILLMNWQAHPDMMGGTLLSADYIGAVREILEKETGMDFIFFLGATGDQNPFSRISGEKTNIGYKKYGAELAQYAIDALPEMTEKIEGQGIAVGQETITYSCNKHGQDRLGDAQKVVDLFRQTGDSAGAAYTLARSLGFESVFHCTGIVSCSKYPLTDEFTVNVLRIGNLGFVVAPYEMFSENGKYIKANSPYPYTVISTCSNAANGYFPTREAFEYGCYEGYSARFASGVGEDTAAKFVELLKEIQ